MQALGHFKTITKHHFLVMQYCFKVGLYRQGLLHDLSKYSPTEFRVGMKYYSGDHSPNAEERNRLGYSTAWLHHKGRNKHHLEYWMDYGSPNLQMTGQPMPTRYMVELCLDRIAACRVYHGDKYTDKDPLAYMDRSLDAHLMHPQTRRQVVEILTMLAEKGEEETMRHIREVVLKHPVELYPNLPPRSDHPETKDETFLSGKSVLALAEKIPTPFYLYSRPVIESRSAALKSAFSGAPGYRQFFPVKATPTPAILKILRETGQGVVCSSAAELELCRRCGFSPDEILFMPNYPTDEDIEKAGQIGCRCLLDGPGLVDRFAGAGLLKDGIGLRLNPGGPFRFGDREVRLDGLKFGFTPDGARACIRELQQRGIRSIGIHGYLSGNALSPDYWPTAARTLLRLGLELNRDTGISIEYLNISGGLGIPYKPEETELDIASVAAEVLSVVEQETRGTALEGIALHTEVGRWITGPAGMLITRVGHIREGFRKIAGVDASAADLMRPMMYGAYHHVSVAGKEGCRDREKWDVVGTVCENTDKFAEQRALPKLEKGDILKIHDAGAHGHSMGYQYGGRLRPAEYLLEGDHRVRRIRRRETEADYFRNMIF